MHEPEGVDLSPLDPERDPERWRRAVQATRFRVAAVLRERERRMDPLDVLGGWTRPILAAAAALVVLLGAAEAALGSARADGAADARRLARLTEHAVLHGRAPSGAEILAAIRSGGTP